MTYILSRSRNLTSVTGPDARSQMEMKCGSINPRPTRGGCLHTPEVFFAQLFGQLFRNFPENFSSRSPKFRSPDQVKWPHLRKKKKSNRVPATLVERKIWNFQDLVQYQVGTCYLCISDFYIGDLRSGQFRDIPIISQWGKTQMPQLGTYQVCSNRSEPCSIRLLLMTSAQLCICDPRKGQIVWDQIMTLWGQYMFFAHNFWLE